MESFLCEGGVFVVGFDGDVVALHLLACYRCCPGAREWVEDEVAFFGVLLQQISDEAEWFLCGVWLSVFEANTTFKPKV